MCLQLTVVRIRQKALEILRTGKFDRMLEKLKFVGGSPVLSEQLGIW